MHAYGVLSDRYRVLRSEQARLTRACTETAVNTNQKPVEK